MHNLATISRIQEIHPIEGKDRIVLAKVENYNSIVQKDEFKPGDLCVYVYYDSFLPEKPEFEFLRKRCYSSRFGGGFRIKPIRMGGVVSEGLVLPLSILPENKRNFKEGTVLDDILGIRNWEDLASNETSNNLPQKKKGRFYSLMKYSWFRRIFGNRYEKNRKKLYEYPCPKSDEDNIEKIWDDVKDSNILFYRSIKKEGQSSTYCLRKGRLLSFSHNFYNNGGSWGKVGAIYDMKNGLKRVNKRFNSSIAIQGEICGPGIQKNIYGYNDLKFFLFGAYDTKTGRRMDVDELHEIASIMNIPEVEYLEQKHILPTIEEMLEDCVIPCKENPNTPYEEGIVWRSYDGSIHFKCKSRPYKVWFS